MKPSDKSQHPHEVIQQQRIHHVRLFDLTIYRRCHREALRARTKKERPSNQHHPKFPTVLIRPASGDRPSISAQNNSRKGGSVRAKGAYLMRSKFEERTKGAAGMRLPFLILVGSGKVWDAFFPFFLPLCLYGSFVSSKHWNE
jgi:hypothetical protein